MLTAADVGHCVGLQASVIESWIRAGHLRAFRLPGVRGLLVDESEFRQDFDILMKNPNSGARS